MIVRRRRRGLGAECESADGSFCFSVTGTATTGQPCVTGAWPFVGKLDSAGKCKPNESSWIPLLVVGVLSFVTVRLVSK